MYMCAMFFITADRLAATLLTIRYQVVWNVHRTKLLLAITWLINTLIPFVLIPILHMRDDVILNKENVFVMKFFIPVVLSIVYLIFAIVSYIIMFTKFTRSKRLSSAESSVHLTSWQIFKKSKFYTSILLITSFLLMWVIPKVTQCFLAITGRLAHSSRVFLILVSLLDMSYTVDFFILVFIYKPVLQVFNRTVRSFRRSFSNIHTRALASSVDTPQVTIDTPV